MKWRLAGTDQSENIKHNKKKKKDCEQTNIDNVKILHCSYNKQIGITLDNANVLRTLFCIDDDFTCLSGFVNKR